MLHVTWLKGKDDLSQVHWIRGEVFTKEQGVARDVDLDAMDAVSEHLLLELEGLSVATGRLYQKDGHYMFGRVAVLKEHRGKGLGSLVVQKLLERAFAAGATEVHIHAQAYLEDYYNRLGFVTYGEHFCEAGIDHVNMLARRDRPN